jgi:hypothetical protein
VSELDPQDSALSPLPTTVTPEMADALLRYRSAGGALGASIGHAIVDPFADIYNYASTNYPGAAEAAEPQRKAFLGAMGLIGPPVGKGLGIAAVALGGAKKAAVPLADLAAQEFRSVLPKSLPLDHTETIISAIKDALGGDWEPTTNMPKVGSAWSKVDEGAVLKEPIVSGDLAKKIPGLSGKNAEQVADYIQNWPDTSVGNMLGFGKDSPYYNHVLPDNMIEAVKSYMDPDYVLKAQKAAEDYAKGNFVHDPNWSPKRLNTASKPSLADEDIDKALAANPGMSLFDLAGVKPKKAISLQPADEAGQNAAMNTGTLPRGATWQLPEKSKNLTASQGYNVLIHHGTRVPTIFDEFKLPENGELGVHFGSPRAAQEIQGSRMPELPSGADPKAPNPEGMEAPRVYPTAIVAQNPLRMSDRGTWYPGDVQRGLVQAGFPEDEVVAARYKGLDTTGMTIGAKSSYMDSKLNEQAANLRDYIASKGHDSIVYKNTVEDKGHDSYILFRESPEKPGHIYGARLPWANFDPAKFKSPNIAAGIPLAGATAAYAASGDGKLRAVQDVEHNPFPNEVSQ